MKNRNQIYQESLEAFLGASREDTLDSEAIIKEAPKHAPRLIEKIKDKQEIKTLDIGSGNGKKALYLARWISSQGAFPSIDAIEPKKEQRTHLEETYRDSSFLRICYPKTLADAQLSQKYDLVLLLHSLYEFPRNKDGTISTFEKIFQVLEDDGVGVIIKEHPESDFQRLKNELHSRFQKPLQITPLAVEKTLQKDHIPYEVGNTIQLEFPVCLEQENISLGRQFDFLFSTQLNDKPLEDSQYEQIAGLVRQNIRKEGNKTYLATANMIFWFYAKDKAYKRLSDRE